MRVLNWFVVGLLKACQERRENEDKQELVSEDKEVQLGPQVGELTHEKICHVCCMFVFTIHVFLPSFPALLDWKICYAFCSLKNPWDKQILVRLICMLKRGHT